MYIWSMFEDSFPFGYLDTVIKATNEYLIHGLRGAPVAQLVKLWPVDVGVLGSRPARGRNLFSGKTGSMYTHKRYCISTSLLYKVILKKEGKLTSTSTVIICL